MGCQVIFPYDRIYPGKFERKAFGDQTKASKSNMPTCVTLKRPWMHRYAIPSRCWLYSKGGTGTLFTRDAFRNWKDRVSLVIDCVLSASRNNAIPYRSF